MNAIETGPSILTISFIVGSVCLFIGGFLGFMIYRWSSQLTLRQANLEALEIVNEMKEQFELQLLDEKEKIQEIELEVWSKVESEFLKIEENVEELQELGDEKKSRLDLTISENKKVYTARENQLFQKEKTWKAREAELGQIKGQIAEVNKELQEKLALRLQATISDTKGEITQKWIEENTRRIQTIAASYIEDAKEHSEARAKRILAIALDRFARPYCPERGIGGVYFPDAQSRKNFCDPKGENIKAVQESCGCDIVVSESTPTEPNDLVGIAGFDPVRRELTRRSLEKILKEKRPITPDFIRKVAENQKQELFRSIRNDGNQIARELRMDGLHPEIRQMMGSLRYRYSFTQNQYFHCGEVGWLAGLMAAELNLEIKKARRAGLLHDLGKSMDHVQHGGHAVIGADFIQGRGEAADIVHAVRAHHYDTTPSEPLDFLVIAADAISGGRPGARRSTIESYNQKVTELQDIARSFEGVTDCFVLSGGRECRVLVNGKRIDDIKALDISRQIAGRIEEECNYPGQIKVVVVRETVATETTVGKNR